MTNEDAKRLFDEAAGVMNADPDRALSLLDELDAARPNSRQVTLNRGLCLVRLGRLDEAQACRDRLAGKIEDGKLAELDALIGAKRAQLGGAATQTARPAEPPRTADIPRPAPAPSTNENVLIVESTFPVSTTEATVTGHMESGVFHTGDTVTVIAENGMPLLAPIRRIGTADAPLKLVREGQRAVLLLEVEPHHVRPGGRLVSRAAEEAYAKTMVVSAASAEDTVPEELSPEILRVERDIKAGQFESAQHALAGYLDAHQGSRTAHRLMARVLLEGPDTIRDKARALEHVRRAYELGGSDDPAVIDTLAWAMGENGEGEHGLRFLERQAGLATDPRAIAALAKRIVDFRERFALGHVWEFGDQYGEVVFETKNLADAARALKNNTIPRAGKVRQDRVGEWRDIEQALADLHPDIKAIYGKPAAGSNLPMMALAAVALLAVLAAAAFMLLR